ncbi:hypothetical protein GCK72_016079 [Caenorhabditis remanei]|uniref:Tudor domain-containing protein n=1 Tax=Caenorhabditis remanei TaxID=31234 RepID=A0A6A5GZ85_CAERE|nr:hypothetical protein GCK72_016079 [Caenorhabditis remanei]KAF1759612.1 hypothetical protein GCK72_016079 [Caenorhabditis remanei]
MPNLPDPYEKCSPEFLNPHAIKRIALKDSAMVDVLRVESPSSLFVRPIDHIRDQLVYREPYPLTPMAKYDAGNYALAPIEERVFGRCIIVRNIELLEACRVFFIDEAITANVSWKCLFEIDEEQRFHPWQVMHVTLGRMVSLTNEWTLEQRQQFLDVISKFPKFQITACQVDIEDPQKETERPSLLVNLYALDEGQSVDEKVSIEEICSVSMDDVMVSIFPINLTEDPKLAELDKEQDNLEIILLEEFRRSLPHDWIHEESQDYVEEDTDWDIKTCHIAEWNESHLQKYLQEDGCFWGYVTTNVNFSPWEMHITPIINQGDGANNEEWIFDQIQALKEKQLEFDDFYSMVKNQRPLEEEEIRVAFNYGRPYAMASVQHRKRDGAQWLRCEILEVMSNDVVAIRYVDQGFRGFEKLRNLHRLHVQHTVQPPFMIEIGKFFKDNSLAETEKEWSDYFWRDIVPTDVPIVVGPKLQFLETGKLLYEEIRNIGETENLLDQIPPLEENTENTDDLRTELDCEEENYESEESDDSLVYF